MAEKRVGIGLQNGSMLRPTTPCPKKAEMYFDVEFAPFGAPGDCDIAPPEKALVVAPIFKQTSNAPRGNTAYPTNAPSNVVVLCYLDTGGRDHVMIY